MSSRAPDFEKLTVTDPKDGARLVSPAVDLMLYIGRDLSTIGAAVLKAYDRFLQLCPPERLAWFCTEHMSRHTPVTKRALDMPRFWLKPGAPARKMIAFEVRDGARPSDTSEYSFSLYGSEEGEPGHQHDVHFLRMSFPATWGASKPDVLLSLARELGDSIPFLSGHGGYVLQTTLYFKKRSQTEAYQLAQRFRGCDIQNEIPDKVAVAKDGIKGVNWLTLLCGEFVERLEGGEAALRASLPTEVEVIGVKGGVILKAGSAPIVGDVNRQEDLSLYKSVYKSVASLQEPTLTRYGSFSLPGGRGGDRTRAWLKRFAPEA